MTPAEATALLRAAGCVYAEDEAAVLIETAGSAAELDAMVAQRVAGRPLEHVVGWAELCGQRVKVEEGVFVPRRRTELLVTEAARLLDPGSVVVDLCCGSGAVAAVLTSLVPGLHAYAVDIDPAAVACARQNLPNGTALVGDLFEPLPGELVGRVDLVVASPPYVPTAEVPLLPREAREHEPQLALDGGPDGLAAHRRIIHSAPDWLAESGHVVLEVSRAQGALTRALMVGRGLDARVVGCDELGATVVVGRKEAASLSG